MTRKQRTSLVLRLVILGELVASPFMLPGNGILRIEAFDQSGTVAQAASEFDAGRYLPPGSKIQDPQKDIAFADIDGDGTREVIIFYVKGGAGEGRPAILVLKPKGKIYVKMWEHSFDVGWGFSPPTGVRDLAKSGIPQIVAYRPVGASCDSQLDIYGYQDGEIRRIVDWNPGTCQASLDFKDLNGDGVPEIIFQTANYRPNPDIYRWVGSRYVLSNSRFPEYYSGRLPELLASVYSRRAMPVPWRMRAVGQVVQIYRLQRRYPNIVHLCEDALKMLDDRNLTVPNVVIKGNESPDETRLIHESFSQEKNRARATLYRFEGVAHNELGNEKESKKMYEKAKALESQN